MYRESVRYGWGFIWLAIVISTGSQAISAAPAIPHNQGSPPGPPLSPEEARQRMAVPKGFHVQLVAAEPDIVNPVAMTFDARGRIWLTESIEYPRRSPGKGRDRIKILEDQNGDGKADKFTVFANDLNIPSGIALGRGGAFVVNAPDLLFLEDLNGDGVADRSEVLLTGFGREDVHEVPNSLTWGPDGWLYGLNGVFNPSLIKHMRREYRFTCALWRYHPVTKNFEVFCEGTSNPWGLDYDHNGNFFVSACVIDHLWYLTQSGYYQRQAGAYPPQTWAIGSIVAHRHFKAAYCGLCYYDADSYPEEFRGNLLMGNIHESAINRETLKRSGASYQANPKPNLLDAKDAWFMPVAQKAGPDGSVYIADWYDRYHCYQDAQRDPAGIDVGKGRVWRVVYDDTKWPQPFDLERISNARLLETLSHANVWWRREAQRILTERDQAEVKPELERLALSDQASGPGPRHALWTRISMGPLDESFHLALLQHKDSIARAWGVRASAGMKQVSQSVLASITRLAADDSPDVRLQVAIAAPQLDGGDRLGLLLAVLNHTQQDPLLPQIVWQNLRPALSGNTDRVVDWLATTPLSGRPANLEVAGRVIDYMMTGESRDLKAYTKLLRKSVTPAQPAHAALAQITLRALVKALQNGELSATEQLAIRESAAADLVSAMPRQDEAGLLATQVMLRWKDPAAQAAAVAIVGNPQRPWPARRDILRILVTLNDPSASAAIRQILTIGASPDVQRDIVAVLGGATDPEIAAVLIEAWPKTADDVMPLVVELLCRRKPWALALLRAVKDGRIPRLAVNDNRARQMAAFKDDALTQLLAEAWGVLRSGRDPERDELILRLRRVVQAGPADPRAGQHIFISRCAQCHKLYDYGAEVGPELTGVGRSDLDQVLTSLLDPNLVVGAGYRAMNVVTTDGRIITGLAVEDSPQRLVLNVNGGDKVVIPRTQIEESKYSDISLMPTGLESGLSDQQFRDLVGLLLTKTLPSPWPIARMTENAPSEP